ncbi:MAG: hypothetical protein AB7I79_10115 [Rhizobiaceae bacterium]
MGLPLLIVLVIVGVGATVLAVHLTGGSRRAEIADEQAAREAFNVEHPDILASDVALTKDRQSAFLALPGDALGVVHVLGDGYLTRVFGPNDVARAAFSDPATVNIRFRDFTWTGGSFTFAEAASAKWLHAALSSRDKA